MRRFNDPFKKKKNVISAKLLFLDIILIMWYPSSVVSCALICGRGGTGRRSALRSLWRRLRGSSSLLDRTIFCLGSI